MNTVAYIALILACVAFGLYVAQVIFQLFKPATPPKDFLADLKAKAADAPTATIPEITALIQAFVALVDSLFKAGPILTSLIASMFFMAIAMGAHAIPDQCTKPATTISTKVGNTTTTTTPTHEPKACE
jgi:hypothetical protein